MRQIFYVRPQEDRSWVVSRFGQPLAVTEDPHHAMELGEKIARKASAAGLATELRVAGPDRSYDRCALFQNGRGVEA